MTTSELVKNLCRKQNVTVAELARRIGQSRQNLHKKLQRDTLTTEELKQIADALNARFEQSFTLNNEKLQIIEDSGAKNSIHKINENDADELSDDELSRLAEDILIEKYDAIYVLDVNKNEVVPVRSSRVSEAGNISDRTDYTELVLRFADTVVPKYKNQWIKFSSPDYMKQYMSEQDTREFIYELPNMEKPMRRFTVNVIDRINNDASLLLLSFEGVDNIRAEEILTHRQLDERNAVEKYILNSFTSVYYVGLDDGIWEVFKRPQILEDSYSVQENYVDCMQRYIDNEVHPDDRDTASILVQPEKLKERLEKQPSFSFTFRKISEEQEKQFSCEVVRGSDENHIILGYKDVSLEENEKKELAVTRDLANQQRHIKAFGDMINAALWSMDINDNDEVTNVYWSDEFRKMFGFEPSIEEFPNTVDAWSSRLHPDDREMALEDLNQAIKSRNTNDFVYDIEYRILRKNNEYCWYRAVGRMEKTDDGNRRIYGIIYDISADKKLAEQQKQLQKALDNAMIVEKRNDFLYEISDASKWSYTIDADGKITSITYADSIREQILAENPDNPLAWFDLLHPEDKERAKDKFMKMVTECNENSVYESTYRIKNKEGKYIWIKSSGRILNHDDGTSEFFGMIVNITEEIEEQKKITAERNEIEKLRAKEQELKHSEFRASALAYLSEHEGDITSYLHFFAERLRKLVNSDQVVYMDMNGNRFVNTSSKLGENFRLNENYCHNCQHYDIHSPVYSKGAVEMSDTSAGWEGIPVNNNCIVKSSLTRIVYLDGEACGYLAIHYILDYHEFSDYERQTLEEFSNLLSMSISRYNVRKKNQELEKELNQKRLAEYESLSQNYERIFALEDNFEALYDVELESGHYDVFAKGKYYKKNILGKIDGTDDFFNDIRAIQLNIADEVHQDDIDELNKILTKESIVSNLAEKEHLDYFYRINTDNGPAWFKLRIVYKDKEKKNIIIGIFNAEDDIEAKQISEQKDRLEKQSKQLEEALIMAQSASRAKTTFLNNMSHDIRTPMNAIIGYTGLAASHIDNKEQVQDYLRKIGQSSDHLLSLINDVLDMSRIESGKMILTEREENLSVIVHTLRDIVQGDISKKQLDFFVDVADVNDEEIFCDRLRLNQVLLNILSNAIKYTASGGTVSLRVKEKTIKNNGYATYEFCIKDNGMGMDEKFLETIFDPFTRVKSTTVSGIQGTGLGMAITKNIVDMMGGKIEIESKLGKGTKVTVSFDFKLQTGPKAPVEIPELKGVRSLVVDDDTNNCLSVTNMLEDIGLYSEWCTTGKEAIIRASASYEKGNPFKVYLIDWLMPDMNGIETTRRIRKVIGDDVPIIILTAYDWSDIEDEAREAGVTAFCSKPLFQSDLHRVLNNCLGKEIEQAVLESKVYDFAGKRVLLVEDNMINCEIATELLTEYGFIVEAAEDGDIAVEKMKNAKKGDYDVVLMDIQMPTMDGYEATRQIRALGTDISKIPIIAMTANAFEEDRQAAFEAGMNEHIAKPINADKLKETLNRFLKEN